MTYATIPAFSVSLSPRALTALLAVVLASTAAAQVPEGWAVASRFRDANQPTLPGGLTMFHPERPGLTMEVAGLGVGLTGSSAPLQINGASAVLVRPNDGALVVGEHVTGIATSVDVHLITLNGNQVAQDVRYPVGQVVLPMGFGWIDQMVWLPDGRVAFTQRGNAFNPAAGFSTVALLDLGSGRVVGLPGAPSALPNALAVSRDGATLYVGALTGNTSRIAAVPVQGGAARFSPTLSGTILQLAVDNDGSLLAGFTGAPVDLLRVDPTTWATTPIPGIANVNALAVENVTGNAIAYGIVNGAEALAVVESGGNLRSLVGIDPAASIPSGIAVVPSMATYGTASPSQNRYDWDIAPSPSGAPVLGNAGFGLTVEASPGTAPGAILFATRPGSVPLSPTLTLRVDPSSTAGVFFLPPAASNTFAIPIPADPVFLDFRLFAQTLHLEGTAFVGSEGLRLTVF